MHLPNIYPVLKKWACIPFGLCPSHLLPKRIKREAWVAPMPVQTIRLSIRNLGHLVISNPW